MPLRRSKTMTVSWSCSTRRTWMRSARGSAYAGTSWRSGTSWSDDPAGASQGEAGARIQAALRAGGAQAEPGRRVAAAARTRVLGERLGWSWRSRPGLRWRRRRGRGEWRRAVAKWDLDENGGSRPFALGSRKSIPPAEANFRYLMEIPARPLFKNLTGYRLNSLSAPKQPLISCYFSFYLLLKSCGVGTYGHDYSCE